MLERATSEIFRKLTEDQCQFWAGPFCLHLITGWLEDHVNSRRVQLTRAECLLWQALAIASPNAVTRAEIGIALSKLKGDVVSERGVRIVVCRLRAQLILLGRKTEIETERGGRYWLRIPASISKIQSVQALQEAA